MVVAETTIPSLAGSPLIRMHPHRGFSLSDAKHQIPDLVADRRSAAGRAVAVCPLPSNELTVPPQERLRPDQERRPPLARQDPAGCHHQQPVPAAEARSGHLTPEHGELMAKDEDLHVVRSSL